MNYPGVNSGVTKDPPDLMAVTLVKEDKEGIDLLWGGCFPLSHIWKRVAAGRVRAR